MIVLPESKCVHATHCKNEVGRHCSRARKIVRRPKPQCEGRSLLGRGSCLLPHYGGYFAQSTVRIGGSIDLLETPSACSPLSHGCFRRKRFAFCDSQNRSICSMSRPNPL